MVKVFIHEGLIEEMAVRRVDFGDVGDQFGWFIHLIETIDLAEIVIRRANRDVAHIDEHQFVIRKHGIARMEITVDNRGGLGQAPQHRFDFIMLAWREPSGPFEEIKSQ